MPAVISTRLKVQRGNRQEVRVLKSCVLTGLVVNRRRDIELNSYWLTGNMAVTTTLSRL